jgi:hypothetical protein
MSVAKVSEISATSSKSFEDAIQQGLKRAGKTLRGIKSDGSRSSRCASAMGRSSSTSAACHFSSTPIASRRAATASSPAAVSVRAR